MKLKSLLFFQLNIYCRMAIMGDAKLRERELCFYAKHLFLSSSRVCSVNGLRAFLSFLISRISPEKAIGVGRDINGKYHKNFSSV